MLRWNPTLIRATAAVAALVVTTVAGAVQLPGAAAVALVLIGIGVAVAAVLVSARRR
jgi:Na+(H+)/acetate symporter ActP